MKNKKTQQIYSKSDSGSIINHAMELVEDNYSKPVSILDNPKVSIPILIICVLTDLVCVLNTQSYIVYDSPLILGLSTLGLLIGLDCAPIFLGKALKNRSQGFNSSRLMMFILFLAFIIAAAFNMALRIKLKDIVLPDFSTAATSLIGDVEQSSGSNDIALLYAIFVASIPVITSLASFGVSFNTSNPLKDEIIKLRASKKIIEDGIIETEAILEEYESDRDYYNRLLEDDDERYNQTVELIEEKAVYCSDYVKEKIKEKLGDAAANNELSKDTRGKLLKMINEDGRAKQVIVDKVMDADASA